jgi:hypothetical protein
MPFAFRLLAVWLFLGVVGGTAAGWLARRVWKEGQRSSALQRGLASASIMGTLGSTLGTALGVVQVLLAMQDLDPSERARSFARGLSIATTSMALGLLVWVPSIVVAAFVLRRERSPKG